MRVGRNDPCPCGSGKKYKKCCLGLDRQAGVSPSQAGSVRQAATSANEWEADIVPLPGGLEDNPAARLAVAMVVGAGLVIHAEVLNRPSPEPEEMAEVLAAAVLTTGEQVGRHPSRVIVREPEVAAAMNRSLEQRTSTGGAGDGRRPEAEADIFVDLDEAAYALVEEMTGRPGRFHVSSVEAWAGWDLPREWTERLFRHAAAFYRAAPWRLLVNLDILDAAMPAGNGWTVCIMGDGEEEFGLSLYSEANDFWAMVEEVQMEAAFDDLEGRIVSLTFDAGGELPRAMRREVAAAGWEVAGADAYPRIFTINTPAGGLRRRDAEDLVALLAAVPLFIAANASVLETGGNVEGWHDEETGVMLSYRQGEKGEERWGREIEVGELAPGGAQGPGAEPEAAVTEMRTAIENPLAFERRERAVVERFERHLAEREGLSSATVAKHAGNAGSLVEFLAGSGVPVRAVHELDLRTFLFDWYPRKGEGGVTRLEAMPVSLRRFFDYLAEEEGIVCPWAAEILADRQALRRRWQNAPRGPFWDADVGYWRQEVAEALVLRLMLPDASLGDEEDEEWGAWMGATEAQLHTELCRRWLLWRDELLHEGVHDGPELVDQLFARQRRWESTPRADLGGKSPLEAVREERAQHPQP